jgi:hypothetical protein
MADLAMNERDLNADRKIWQEISSDDRMWNIARLANWRIFPQNDRTFQGDAKDQE